MGIRFTADQARKAVEEARVPLKIETVYAHIERLAKRSHVSAVFVLKAWSDELTETLAEDGYSLRARPRDNEMWVTWTKDADIQE